MKSSKCFEMHLSLFTFCLLFIVTVAQDQGLCDNPPPVPHGNISGSEREVGSVVSYSCHSGYILLGNVERNCLPSLEWDGHTPVCHLPCPPLPFVELDNGEIITLPDEKFRFRCNPDHFLTGPEIIMCKNGTWVPSSFPRCYSREGFCEPLPSIPNAIIIGDDRRVGSAVIYICHPGYFLVGNDRRHCLQSQGWDGLTPSCQLESEPLPSISQRLKKDFVDELGSASVDSRARLLDRTSIYDGLELVILLDRSSSVDPMDFKKGIEFIKYLMEEFGVKNGENKKGTRVAVITFGTEVDIVFNLDNAAISDAEKANRVLDTLQANGGGTAMEPALTTVLFSVKPLLRPGAKKALFMVSDGIPNIGDADITPEDLAKQLIRYEGFEIFTIGLGKEADKNLLTRISSKPVQNHVFLLSKYADLGDMVWLMQNSPTPAPPPGPNQCGYIPVSEDAAPSASWPWLAAVYVNFGGQLSLCSGTLICNQWVLTAASCFYRINGNNVSISLEEVFVAMGENNLLKKDSIQQNFYAVDVVIHPEFQPLVGMVNNLALIELNEPVPLNVTYRPICLPRSDRQISFHQDLSRNTSSAGWGLPVGPHVMYGINGATTRRKVKITTMALAEDSECQRNSKNMPLNNIFCAGTGGDDTCVSNIGSPLVTKENDIHYVIGIVSMRGICNQGYNHFAKLDHYREWIDRTTGSCNSNHWKNK